MNKQMIVLLEGVDGTGKTTIKKALEKKSNWKYIVTDRLIASSIVYDKLYNRKDREHILLELERDLARIAEVYMIYLECDNEILLKRLKYKKEDQDIILKIKASKRAFSKYLNATCLRYKKLNTSKDFPNETVDKIIKFVEEGGKQ